MLSDTLDSCILDTPPPLRTHVPGGHPMNNERLFHASEMLVISREISFFVYEEITCEPGHALRRKMERRGGRWTSRGPGFRRGV